MQIRHFESARLGADLIWRGGSLLVASLRPVTVNMARIGKSSEFTRCRPRKNRLARKLARAWKSVGSWTRVEYANGWRASWKRSERAANVRRNWKARQWIARTLLLRASTRLHAPLHTPEQIRRWYDTAWEQIDRAYTIHLHPKPTWMKAESWREKKISRLPSSRKSFDILHFCSEYRCTHIVIYTI